MQVRQKMKNPDYLQKKFKLKHTLLYERDLHAIFGYVSEKLVHKSY
jgi:hypothetical protein